MALFSTEKKPSAAGLAIIGASLVLLTVATMIPVVENSFVSFDDDLYITDNPRIRDGVKWTSLVHFLVHPHADNWHPLTSLSHMLDVSLFGLNPAGHHLSSLFIHSASTLLLFLLLVRMTGDAWESAFVAALFAIHPLHVESVAWASERKDVLSGLFWILTLLLYLRYVRRPSAWRYTAVLAAFGAGLMAKQMLVTLPVVMLLLDFWPLGRLEGDWDGAGRHWRTWGRLLAEKIPLFVMAGLAGLIVFAVQLQAGIVKPLNAVPLVMRVANAVLAYVEYLEKAIWPTDLAIFYPHPGWNLQATQTLGAASVLAGVTILAVLLRRRLPYLLVGWLWYVVALAPVVGLVQVGVQAMADRYTYLPLIGVFVMLAWGIEDLTARWPMQRVLLAAAAAVALVGLALAARVQTRCWKDSRTLYEHAIRAVPNNYWAHYNLGVELDREKELELAAGEYEKAIRAKYDFPEAHYNLAVDLAALGRNPRAAHHYRVAIGIRPGHAQAHNNLAAILAEEGRVTEAVRHYRQALAADKDLAEAHAGLGILLERQGKADEAGAHFREALRVRPDWPLVMGRLKALENRTGSP